MLCCVSCVQVAALIKSYLVRFGLAPVFSKTEVAHWFLPRTDVIVSYVVEDKATGKITDFLSFYSLPSTIIGNPTYKTLRYPPPLTAPPPTCLPAHVVCHVGSAAYSYYNVAGKTPLKNLMQVRTLRVRVLWRLFVCRVR